ncbi:MAG: tetratricopeptide repeat protein [Terriglobales bacterium]
MAPAVMAAVPPTAKADLAAAYYHYMLARLYEGRAELAGSGELASQALQQYRMAMDADPHSSFLPVQMAGLLFRTGRTGDAIRLARSVTHEQPDSVSAHELLGEIYARLLDSNDPHAGGMLRLAAEQFQALTRLRPQDPEFHLALGRLYSAEGDVSGAEKEFQTVRRLAQDSPDGVADLVRLYAGHGQMAQAESVFASVPADQRTAPMYAALGAAYQKRNDTTQAAHAFQQAVALDSGNPDYRRSLASSLYRDGQLAAAREQYVWLTLAEPQNGSYWLRLAEIDQHTGQRQRVAQDLDAAQQSVPDDPALAFFRSQFEESEGRFGQAADALRVVLKATAVAAGQYAPNVAQERGLFWEKLGTLERQAGHPQQAIAAFTRMQNLGRQNRIRGYLQIAQTYGHIHQYAQALASARSGVAAFPHARALAVSYALLLAGNRQVRPAVASLQPFLQQPSDRRITYLALAEVQERVKHWSAANRALAQAAALSSTPAQRGMIEFMRGDVASQRHRFRSAQQHLQAALRLDPNNALALNDLGYLWADRGVHLRQALEDVQRAVAAEPENGAYLDSLGWVYFKMHQWPQALRQLQRAVQLERHDPTIRGHLASAYQQAGRLPQAAVAWQKALANWRSSAPADADPHAMARDRKQLARVQKALAAK